MTAPDTLPPVLEELGALLREDPPRPDAAWARELDSRAAAGFPRPSRKRHRLKLPSGLFLPAAGLAATAAVAVIVVIGVSTPGNVGDGDSGAGGSGSSAGGGSTAAPR